MRIMSVNNGVSNLRNQSNVQNQPAFGATINANKGAKVMLASLGDGFLKELEKLAPEIRDLKFEGKEVELALSGNLASSSSPIFIKARIADGAEARSGEHFWIERRPVSGHAENILSCFKSAIARLASPEIMERGVPEVEGVLKSINGK